MNDILKNIKRDKETGYFMVSKENYSTPCETFLDAIKELLNS
jgi:hypothetical protein